MYNLILCDSHKIIYAMFECTIRSIVKMFQKMSQSNIFLSDLKSSLTKT